MFVLYTATLAETTGMQCCVAFVVIAVQQHQRQGFRRSPVQGIDSSNGTLFVDSRLTGYPPSVVVIAIVQTDIGKVGT